MSLFKLFIVLIIFEMSSADDAAVRVMSGRGEMQARPGETGDKVC